MKLMSFYEFIKLKETGTSTANVAIVPSKVPFGMVTRQFPDMGLGDAGSFAFPSNKRKKKKKKINEVHWDSGLGKWLKEKWVDISRKDKSGKHPPCGASAEKEGRDKDQKKAYPKCRPVKEAGSMSKEEKKKAVSQKRRAEKKSGHHKGRKPVMVSHKKMDENIINEGKNKPNNPSLWAKAKSAAKQKFDVYPSAYANLWASKWYKNHGGTWRKVNESNFSSFSEWLETRLNNGNEDELRQE